MGPVDLLHTCFEQRAARAGANSALEYRDQQYTYAALNWLAYQFAQELTAAGVRPHTHVAVMLEKSPELIVACLGILKAGGVYVPIDPAYPPERIRQIMAAARPVVAITRPAHSSLFLSGGVRTVTSIDTGTKPFMPDIVMSSRCEPQDLAYIIFTSGSTGRPKGVMVEHRSIVNTIECIGERYHVSDRSRVLLFSSPGFDASLADIFLALSFGGTLVIPDEHVLANLHKLSEFITSRRVTIATLPPAILEHLVIRSDSTLRTLISAGDVCPLELARWYVGKVQHFVNAYGPTECSICVTTHEVSEASGVHVPIGTALENVETFVFDDNLHEVAPDAVGVLYVGGIGVARGYIGGTPSDRMRFVRHPTHPDSRLYRTGDRVYKDREGILHYVGREDSLIKVHGVRMDAGDIEAAVRSLAGIRGCAVVLRGTRGRDKRLTCFYSAADSIPHHVLRAHVSSRLPRQFVPQTFVFLEHLPLTSHGKVDRNILASIAYDTGESSVDSAATSPLRTQPRDEDGAVASVVRRTWARMLDVGELDPSKSFYEHGGDSLGAMRVAAELSESLGIDVDATDVVSASSYAAFVTRLDGPEAQSRARPSTPFVPTWVVSPRVAYPLASIQEMFWFLQQLEPDAPVNNASKAIQLRGAIDLDIWTACSEEVIVRHRALGARFFDSDAGPQQVFDGGTIVKMRIVDISGEPAATRRQLRLQLLYEQCWSPFDLEAGPLVRMMLLKTGSKRFVFVLTTHHIVCDGLSVDMIISEILRTYAARTEGGSATLTSEPSGFADFIASQAQDTGGRDEDRDYWVHCLADAVPSVDLPYDAPLARRSRYQGRTCVGYLGKDVKRRIEQIAEMLDASVNEILLAGFAVFLHRICQQDDIVIGVPVSLRDRWEWQDTVGVFLNVLPLRRTLRPAMSVREYIRETHADFQRSLRHRRLGFNRIVEALNPKRDLGINPLFNVMFDYAVGPDLNVVSPIRAAEYLLPGAISKFDLSLSVVSHPDQLELTLEYDAHRFRRATAKRFLGNLQTCLTAMVQHEDALVTDLSIMSDTERAKVLAFGRGNPLPLPGDSIVSVFERQCASLPDAPAVRCGKTEVTYAELLKRVYAIGTRLHSLGVRHGSVIALVMERSIDTVASIFATWKLGCAYVPIEPDLPEARIEAMLLDSVASVVVLDSQLRHTTSRWRNAFEHQTVPLDEVLADEMCDREALRGLTGINREDLAYIIFTSGSTGRPKGVMIEHDGLLNHALALIRQLDLGPSSVVAQSASLSFDVSVWQLTAPLLVGGQVSIYPRGVVMEVSNFMNLLVTDQVSHLEVVPAYLSAMLDAAKRQRHKMLLGHLRFLIVTGEAAPSVLVRRWFRRFPNVPVMNAYGPAEASDDVATLTLDRLGSCAKPYLPVGMPLPNVMLYVLDGALMPCPIGVCGEICISGFVVGRGYVRAEDGPAAFGSDPLASQPGTRLYRTGDIGRWNDQGELEFLGRADQQVKLYGQRMELGEIESHLRTLVDDAAVSLRQQRNGLQTLVAFYSGPDDVTPDRLRSALLSVLPRYMVPSQFARLHSLPRNANGKLDRKRLLDIDVTQGRSATDGNLTHPLAKRICAVWRRWLHVEDISVDDNFFDLGGDSLTAVRIVGQLASLGVHLTVKDLYMHQTVRELVSHVSAIVGGQGDAVQTHRPLPLTPMQAEFFSHHYADPAFYTLAVMVDTPILDPERLQVAFSRIQRQHEALRLTFTEDAQGHISQVVGPVRRHLVHMFGHIESVGDAAQETCMQDQLRETLDLQHGPVFAAGFAYDNVRGLLVMVAHHTVVDVLSWGILVDDLEKAYRQKRTGRAARVRDALTSMSDWTRGVQERTRAAAFTDQVPYWQHILDTQRPIFASDATPSVLSEETFTHVLDRDRTSALQEITHRTPGLSTEAVLLTPLAEALSISKPIVIWIERNGRDIPDWPFSLARMVGWCTVLFPFALRRHQNTDMLEQVINLDRDLAAVPNRGGDFGLLRYLTPYITAPQITSNTRNDFIFNYLGTMDDPATETGLFSNLRLFKDRIIAAENKIPGQTELDCYIKRGILVCEWRVRAWPERLSHVRAVARTYAEVLDSAIDTLVQHAAHRNRTNFALLSVDNDRLAALRARLKDARSE